MTQTSHIRVQGLSKSYQEGDLEHAVLRAVDLDIAQGEFVALLGASGSGKSTLLNLLSGIDEADAGQIWLDGRDLVSLSENERTLFRRQHIGFIFQFFNLLPTLTARENVSLQLELDGAAPRQAAERAQAMLQAVGLGERGDSYPDRLSGGEQQRVAIARDRKSTRLNSSHSQQSRMPSSA